MSQVSYGTITITDTNDIESIIVEYAQNQSTSTPPDSETGGWSTTRPTWAENYYIWQRTRIHRADTDASSDTFGTAVCLTGSTGQTGTTGRGVSGVTTKYATNNSTSTAPTSGWQDEPPTYSSSNPKYWVQVTTTYTSGNPDVVTYLDNGITDAMATAASANSTATNAWNKADNAEDVAQQASDDVEALETTYNTFIDTQAKYFVRNSTGSIVIGSRENEDPAIAFDVNDVSTYGYNTLNAPTYLALRYNTTELAKLSTGALIFYKPNTTNKGLELTSTALTFYNPSTNSAQLIIGANGALQSGNYNYRTDLTEKRFSVSGTKIDLIKGDIITPNFRLASGETDSIDAGAYIRGTIEALSGYIQQMYIGTSETNRWEIGNFVNYDQSSSAALISSGTAFIQLGESNTWRLSTDRIHTAWIANNSTALTFPIYDDKYWDWGIHSPHQTNNVWKDKFLYIRNADENTNTAAALAQDLDDDMGLWDYQFYIDRQGNVHAPAYYVGEEPLNGDTGSIAGKIINADSTYGKGSATHPIYLDSNGRPAETTYTLNAAGAKGVDTSISTASTSTNLPTSAAVASFVEGKGYITSYTNTTYSLTQDSSNGHTITLTPSSGTAQTITIPDNNTTYTFTGGTNGFTVTPSDGSAQTVTVTPSISNNVTGSGTSGYLVKWNGTNTITNGPALGTGTTKFLREDGTWVTPTGTYSLGIATYNTLGGLKPWYSHTTASTGPTAGSNSTAVTVNAITTTSGKYYAVESDSNGRLFVNVPWTDNNDTSFTITAAASDDDIVILTGTNGTNKVTYSASHATSGVTAGSYGDSAAQTPSYGGTFSVPCITVDTYGHITGISTHTVTIPSSDNVDTKVTQTNTTTNAEYRVLFSENANDTTQTAGARKNTSFKYNPSTGTVTATKFVGSLTGNVTGTASGNLTSSSDLAWDKITGAPTTLSGYGITDAKIASGVITLGSNTITPLTSQWTANLITGASATAKANAAASTNVYLNLIENSTVRNSHQITGSGTVSVASDANGKITITGSAHPTTLPNPKTLTVNIYNSTSTTATSTATTYYGGESANTSISVAGTNAVTNISSNTAGQLILTKADGTQSSPITVKITATTSDSAASAEKLNLSEDVGSTSVPVYFPSNTGLPTAVTSIAYSLLPTGTTASTVATGNHTHGISLATDTGTSSITLAHGGKYKLTAGGQSVIFTLPSDNNTDTKVTQAYSTTNNSYPLLMTATSGITSTNSRGAVTAILNNEIYANPSTGTIVATTFSGNATTATTASKLGSSSLGSATKPIYLSSGTATEGSTYAGGTAVTLNGTSKAASTASFYAPTSAGTEGYVLVANASGIPSWVSQGSITSGNTYDTSIAASTGTSQLSLAYGTKYSLNAGGTSYIFTTPSLGTTATTAAKGDHTHTTSIATSTATNGITLTYGGKYALTAGGTSYVFTMPASDNTNTTYTITTGDSNGQIKVTPSSGSAYNVNVKGLGSAAYTASTAYATSSHSHTITAEASDDDIVVLSGTNGTNKVTYSASHAESGVTAGSYGDSASQTPAYGNTFKVPYITVNATGHITSISAHTVKIPASDNTTYTIATGDSNGQIKVTPSSGSAYNVSIKGLGSAAYTASTAYATSGHTHDISIITSTGTSSITLAYGDKYSITAGGSSYVFTMPANPNTDTKVKLTSQSANGIYPLIFGPTSITSENAYETYYNTNIVVNPADGIIKSPKGIFTELIATNANITELTAENATVVGLLDVQGQLHANSWTNSNIATIDGSFFITPTVSVAYGTFTYNPAANSGLGQITLNGVTKDGTDYTFGVDNNWTTGSLVMLTGQVAGTDAMMPLGTIRGTLSSASSDTIIINGPFTDSEGNSCATLTAIGSKSGVDGEKLKVSLYQKKLSDGLAPLGIYMTSGGYETQNKSFIDIYNGGNITTTATSSSGAFAKPVLRIGNLVGLPRLTNTAQDLIPVGYGIYTTNGYFEGIIAATKGYIGGFTIGDTTLTNGIIGNANSVSMNTSGATNSIYYIQDSPDAVWNVSENSSWAFTAGNHFAVDMSGKMYTHSATLTGNVSIGDENGVHIYIDGNMIGFYNGTHSGNNSDGKSNYEVNRTAYITENRLYIPYSVVLNEMQVGTKKVTVNGVLEERPLWAWRKTSNGNLRLVWLGGDD